ncbi:MAG: M13 family peptidase, partial [Burkholderiaceae bacterium]
MIPFRLILPACALAVAQWSFVPVAVAQQPALLTSGIDRSTADPAVRIQDDAFRAVEGKWLGSVKIPADRNSIGGFEKLYDETQPKLRELIEHLGTTGAADPGGAADGKKIADLYASFMDEARIESVGIEAVSGDLAKIDGLASKADVAAMIGELDRIGVDTPFAVQVHQDAQDSTKYVADLGQGGIGLPNRDYFLAKNDKRFAAIRVKYQAYLAQLLTMAGERDAAAKAKAVVALETRIAQAQWTRVQNRDPVKTYNVVAIADLPKLAPHIDWPRYLAASRIAGKADSVVISQPTYIAGLDRLIATVPLSTWKAYFETSFLNAYAPYLDKRFVDASFAFVGTALRDTPENKPRWKRGVRFVEGGMGDALGRLYVARYFPPENKARIDTLVNNLLAAYRVSIDGLDWMSAATKKEAAAKLATFKPKIGYPSRWRDYTGLTVDRDDLVGNQHRARIFESDYQIDKLGKPVDRDEWGMTPQTI